MGGSYSGGRALVEAASGAKDLVELATGRILEDEDDFLFVVEPGEEAEHVGVVEVALDLDLPPQLRVEAVLLQLRLENITFSATTYPLWIIITTRRLTSIGGEILG